MIAIILISWYHTVCRYATADGNLNTFMKLVINLTKLWLRVHLLAFDDTQRDCQSCFTTLGTKQE